MHATRQPAPSRPGRFGTLFAAAVAIATLAACDGPRHAPPPLAVTVTATDSTGPRVKGQDAVFTYVVTNPTASAVPKVQLRTAGVQVAPGVASPLGLPVVACVAQGATCPVFSVAGIADPFTLPAGGVLTFTVTAPVSVDYAGTVDQELEVFSTERSGDTLAKAHVVLADAREGYYEVFATSGLRTNLDVRFTAGATKFAVSSGSAESTFVPHRSGFVFASGLSFVAGPDLLVGQADFGHGAETFIGARLLVDTLADLDGTTFTLMGVATPAGGAAAGTLRTLAITGATLAQCADPAPHALANCPTASLRHYAVTQNGVIFTATDSVDNDRFDFQVARSGGQLILLQADQGGAGGVFAVGLSAATIVTSEMAAIGTVGGTHDLLDLMPDSFALWAIDVEANVTSQGAMAALAPVANGPTALVTGVRPTDNATLLMLQQSGLLLVSGPAGAFDILIDVRRR